MRSFSLEFARLLGLAAAPNIIVGRCDEVEEKVLFDDGDEVVIVDARGMPVEIKVADQTGTFVDYLKPLQDSAAAYADPVNRRIEYLPDPEGFARAYLEAFVEKFSCRPGEISPPAEGHSTRCSSNRPYERGRQFGLSLGAGLETSRRNRSPRTGGNHPSHLEIPAVA